MINQPCQMTWPSREIINPSEWFGIAIRRYNLYHLVRFY